MFDCRKKDKVVLLQQQYKTFSIITKDKSEQVAERNILLTQNHCVDVENQKYDGDKYCTVHVFFVTLVSERGNLLVIALENCCVL